MAAMANTITPQQISRMVAHNLGCPPGGYLGSFYGADLKSVLMTPMSSPAVDDLIAKMRLDIPLLGEAPAGAVSITHYDQGIDQKVILVDVLGQAFTVEAA